MERVIEPTAAWHAAFPGACVGVLAMSDLENPPRHPELEAVVSDLERELRARFGPMDRDALRAIAPLPAYAAHFKRFGQRYHVALQLESVVHKGKPLPRVAALVEAMFAAELRHLVLTAGHDLVAVSLPLRFGVGTGTERYATPRGDEVAVRPGDMYCADSDGVLSAATTGPAARARISPTTTSAIFVAYGPAGVSPATVEALLTTIEANCRIISSFPVTLHRQVVAALGQHGGS